MTLYAINVITGEKIAEINGIEEIKTLSAENCCIGVDTSTKEDMTASFTCKVDKLALLSVLLGKRITNNWLRLHGGVLQRKRHRR